MGTNRIIKKNKEARTKSDILNILTALKESLQISKDYIPRCIEIESSLKKAAVFYKDVEPNEDMFKIVDELLTDSDEIITELTKVSDDISDILNKKDVKTFLKDVDERMFAAELIQTFHLGKLAMIELHGKYALQIENKAV